MTGLMPTDRLLSIPQAAEFLGTSPRFPRRLIEQRRIAFVRVGRHVRISTAALVEYANAHTVPPADRSRSWAL